MIKTNMVEKKVKVKSNSKLKDFLLFLGIPIGALLLIPLFIALPGVLANPKYDFIYKACYAYECRYDLYETQATKEHPSESYYRYHAKENATSPVSKEEATTLAKDKKSRSPDGYELVFNKETYNGPFWSRNNQNWSLKNGFKSRELNLQSGDFNTSNIQFIGWVTKNE